MEVSTYLTPIRNLSKEPLERAEYLAGYHLLCETNADQGDGSVLYNCFIKGNVPSNVLIVNNLHSLENLNKIKSEKLREWVEKIEESDDYEGLERLKSNFKGNLDFSFYDFSIGDEYELIFTHHSADLIFQNCIFSHITVRGGFTFKGCDFRGSTFDNVNIIHFSTWNKDYDFVFFDNCDLRNVRFDESIKNNCDMQHCIIESQQAYNAQKKEGFDNMLIIKGKAFNVVKELAREHYDFSKINFEGLSFKGFNRLAGVYKHCNFTKANLSDINVIANIDFSLCINADFSESTFSCEVEPFEYRSGSAFREMPKIVGVDFTNANFEKAEISNCMFIDCNFEGVNFSGAVYSDDTLSHSNCIPKDAIDVMIHIDDAEDEDDFFNLFR